MGDEEIFGKFRGKHGVIRKRETKIVKRQNKILTHGLHENDNTNIMTDSPVQYLRNGNFTQKITFYLHPSCTVCVHVCTNHVPRGRATNRYMCIYMYILQCYLYSVQY